LKSAGYQTTDWFNYTVAKLAILITI